MKKCDRCGCENIDSSCFCTDCGAELADDAPTCSACGAPVEQGAKYCGACGARIEVEQRRKSAVCPTCGAQAERDAEFCKQCGTKIGSDAVSPKAVRGGKKTRVSDGIASAKNKTLAFEKKHGIIVNALIAVCAIVVVFVSLFVPVKFCVGEGLDDLTGSDMFADSTAIKTETKCMEVEQSLWKMLGALGYLRLDIADEDDLEKMNECYERYDEALELAQKEYKDWLNDHPYASEAKKKEALLDLREDYLSDINYSALNLTLTTDGFLNLKLNEEMGLTGSKALDIEKTLKDTLAYMRSSAVFTVSLGAAAALVAIALAAVSLVFLALAAVGMARKCTPLGLFSYLNTTLIASGVGLMLLSLSSQTKASGGLFAVALFAAIAYAVCGAVYAIVSGASLRVVIKRAVIAAIALAAFFILCTDMIKLTQMQKTADNKTTTIIKAPLCIIVDACFAAFNLKSVTSFDFDYGNTVLVYIKYGTTSVAGLITALIFGAAMLALSYFALVVSLRSLAKRRDGKSRADWVLLAAAISMLLFIVVPSILGATSELPATFKEETLAVIFKIAPRAQAYVSLVLSSAAFVFAKAFPARVRSAGNSL